ncbi:LysR family transcriptional regulator [Ideonella sp. BN130291]|uniref:LysR family transcriptional regulator n=1 Tax=Ideonella sp. BN130291 TaxID=3112940 RepID=UPI002E25A106|nr:LysR family transcriptional regulator [Ideonella sp. BN130291]
MFQLRQLKTFLAAADTLSFTQAAQRVHLSQSSVSEQMQALESSVGQPLFVRTHNTLALTPAGERLVERARQLLALADDALRQARGEVGDSGATLCVVAPQTLCTSVLLPLVARHAQRHPALVVQVQERDSLATAAAVLDGSADLGLVHGWPAAQAALQVEELARDQPMVVLPVGHALAAGAAVAAHELAACPLVLTTPGCRYRAYLDALLQQAPVQPQLRGVADSVPALLQMVSAGLGVTVLPRRALQGAGAGIVLRALSPAGDGLPICLLTPAGRPLPRELAPFITALRQALASHQPVPALHVQHGAGGVAVAEQEQDRVGDVVGGADPAHR